MRLAGDFCVRVGRTKRTEGIGLWVHIWKNALSGYPELSQIKRFRVPALSAIELVGTRTAGMPDTMLEMCLHGAIRTGPMRSNCPMALRAAQLSFSVAGQSLVYRDGVPSLVGPKLAIFNHGVRMARAGGALQVWERALRASGEFQADTRSDLASGCTSRGRTEGAAQRSLSWPGHFAIAARTASRIALSRLRPVSLVVSATRP